MGRAVRPSPRIVLDARVRTPDRRRGELDTTDLGVGIALLVIVPVLVYFVGAFFIEDHYVEPMGERPKVEAPADREEVQLHLREATMLLTRNAPYYSKLMTVTEDTVLRDKFRQWAQRALEEGLSKLDEISNSLIKDHPDGASAFAAEVQTIARLRASGQAELKKVRQLDVLGSDR